MCVPLYQYIHAFHHKKGIEHNFSLLSLCQQKSDTRKLKKKHVCISFDLMLSLQEILCRGGSETLSLQCTFYTLFKCIILFKDINIVEGSLYSTYFHSRKIWVFIKKKK